MPTRDESGADAARHRSLQRPGGWLFFFIVWIAVITPLAGCFRLAGALLGFGVNTSQLRSLAGWSSYLIFSGLLLATLIAWRLSVAHALAFKREPESVVKAKALLWLSPFVAFVDLFGALSFLEVRNSNRLIVASIGDALGAAVPCIIWLIYFSRSKRVRNTYGPTVADPRPTQLPG